MPTSRSSNVCGLNSSPVTDGWFRGQVSNDVRWQATDGFGHLNQKDPTYSVASSSSTTACRLHTPRRRNDPGTRRPRGLSPQMTVQTLSRQRPAVPVGHTTLPGPCRPHLGRPITGISIEADRTQPTHNAHSITRPSPASERNTSALTWHPIIASRDREPITDGGRVMWGLNGRRATTVRRKCGSDVGVLACDYEWGAGCAVTDRKCRTGRVARLSPTAIIERVLGVGCAA
jgi:hypothetical protein